MSKKHNQQNIQYQTSKDHAAEYAVIKQDLLKVGVLNVLYLGAILALYFSNRQSGFLERWFAKILNS